MSGAFPISNAKFSTMGIKSMQTTIISKSDSGKRLARQIDGQRFAFTVEIIRCRYPLRLDRKFIWVRQ